MESFSHGIRQQLLESVAALVRDRLFDPTFNGHDWKALLDSRRERILNSEQSDDFVLEVQDLLNQLAVRPMHFFHQSKATVPFQRATWATLFPVGNQWMFQDVHLDGPAFDAGIESGDILLAVNRSPVATPAGAQLPAVAPITFTVERRGGRQVMLDLQPPPVNQKRSRPPRFVSASELPDHVGYVRISSFPGLVESTLPTTSTAPFDS
jgi:membrane-associated protease RseP (regulator of RpoE activity)